MGRRKRIEAEAEGRRVSGEPDTRRALTASETPATGKRFEVAQKVALLEEFGRGTESMKDFCARQHLSTATLCKWRREQGASGVAGLQPKPNPRNAHGRHPGPYGPDDRRKAVESFAHSGMTRAAFAQLWGVSLGALSQWLRRYREAGPKGLERRPSPRGAHAHGKQALPAVVREEIARTQLRFPTFGLRKVRDWLKRFRGIEVSPGGVRSALAATGVARPPPAVHSRKLKPRQVRRFERARPGELWQSDITSFVLARHRQRVYLTVFLDDCSRYIVSHALEVHQRRELVERALLEGIARFGKPREVLTDQGPQYFAWRGKSDFQKLLVREGIQHVVARTHHPQTVGKCERLWETIGREFWERVAPQDLADAQTRLTHWIAHYNHFRPHQGLDGVVPADRFFAAESALRKTLEATLAQHELALALDEAPRKSVFLFGQIGEQQVSLHGEQGRLVIQTPEGGRQEIGMEALGITSARGRGVNGAGSRAATTGAADAATANSPSEAQKEEHHDGDAGTHANSRDPVRGDVDEAAAREARAQADALQGGGAGGAAGAGAVGAGERGGAAAGARDVRGDDRVLAREGDAGGGGDAAGCDAAAGVATLAAGGVGDDGGALEAAAAARSTSGDDGARSSAGSADAEAPSGGAGAGTEAGAGRGETPAGPAREPGVVP